jgi:hypothetical protein
VEEALLQEKEVLKKFSSRGEGSSDRAQDVLKVLTLDQEDQEETNILFSCYIKRTIKYSIFYYF